MKPDVTVVIPVFKNKSSLLELHRRLTTVLDESGDYEILFVDDACPEGSLEVLRDLAHRDRRVAVIVLENNAGQNRALMMGLAHCQGEVVVTLDADLQDPPEAIPSLLRALGGKAAAVFAGRRGRYESPGRLLSSRAFKWVLHLLSRKRLPSDAGLFLAMKRKVVERLLTFECRDPYLVGLIARTGFPLASYPVVRSPAPGGTSSYTGRMRWCLTWLALVSLVAPRKPISRRRRGWEVPVREYIGLRFSPEEN